MRFNSLRFLRNQARSTFGIVKVTCRFTDSISVRLANPDGSLQPPEEYSVGDGPSSVLITDLNSDGTLDLAVTNWNSNDLSILLGAGQGSFLQAQTHATGGNPSSVAAADLTGDGKPDLAVANHGDSTVSILIHATPSRPASLESVLLLLLDDD